jgi:hypothetical protein
LRTQEHFCKAVHEFSFQPDEKRARLIDLKREHLIDIGYALRKSCHLKNSFWAFDDNRSNFSWILSVVAPMQRRSKFRPVEPNDANLTQN